MADFGVSVKVDNTDVNRATQTIGQSFSSLEKSIDRLGDKFDKAFDSKPAKKNTKEVDDSLKGVEGRLDGIAKAGKAAFAFVAASEASQRVQQLIRNYAEFEQQLVGVAKTTNLSGQELDRLEQSITNLSRTIPVSRRELLEIGQAAGQLGVSGVDNITLFSETIAKLGRASNLAGEEAATSLTRILNVTGSSIDQIDELASATVALGNTFAATEAEIAAVTTRVAQVSGQFGVTVDDALALGGALASLGVQAESGGSAIGRVFAEIETAVQTGSRELEEFARIAGTTSEEFQKLYEEDALGAFQAFVDGLAQSESVTIALNRVGLTGVETARVLGALSSRNDELARSIRTVNSEFENATALNREAATAFDTTQGDLDQLANSFDRTTTSIGGFLTRLLEIPIAAATVGFDVIGEGIENTNDAIDRDRRQSLARGVAERAGQLVDDTQSQLNDLLRQQAQQEEGGFLGLFSLPSNERSRNELQTRIDALQEELRIRQNILDVRRQEIDLSAESGFTPLSIEEAGRFGTSFFDFEGVGPSALDQFRNRQRPSATGSTESLPEISKNAQTLLNTLEAQNQLQQELLAGDEQRAEFLRVQSQFQRAENRLFNPDEEERVNSALRERVQIQGQLANQQLETSLDDQLLGLNAILDGQQQYLPLLRLEADLKRRNLTISESERTARKQQLDDIRAANSQIASNQTIQSLENQLAIIQAQNSGNQEKVQLLQIEQQFLQQNLVLSEETRQKAAEIIGQLQQAQADGIYSDAVEQLELQNEELELILSGQEDMIPLLRLENQLRESGKELSEEDAQNYLQRIQRQRQLNEAIQAQEEIIGTIEDAFLDASRDIADVWRTGFDGTFDSIRDGFSDLITDLIFQAAVRPIALNVAAGVTGSLGLGQGQVGPINAGNILNSVGSFDPAKIASNLPSLDTISNFFGSSGIPGGGVGSLDAARIAGINAGQGGSFLSDVNFGSIANIGAGFAGNFLGNALFGSNRGVGASAGGAIGSIVGGSGAVSSALTPVLGAAGGPIGIALGALAGNFVGGLFGGRAPTNEASTAGIIDPQTGRLTNIVGGATGKGDQQAAANFVSSTLEPITQSIAALDVGIQGAVIGFRNTEGQLSIVSQAFERGAEESTFVFNNFDPQSEESVSEAIADAIIRSIALSTDINSAIDANVSDQERLQLSLENARIQTLALNDALGQTPEEIQSNIIFIRNFNDLFVEVEQQALTPFSDAVEQINKASQDAIQTATDLGFSIDEIADVSGRATDALGRFRQSVVDDIETRLRDIQSGFDLSGTVAGIQVAIDEFNDLQNAGIDTAAFLTLQFELFSQSIDRLTIPQLEALEDQLLSISDGSQVLSDALSQVGDSIADAVSVARQERIAANDNLFADILGFNNAPAAQFFNLLQSQEAQRQGLIDQGVNVGLIDRRNQLEREAFLQGLVNQSNEQLITTIDGTISALEGLADGVDDAIFDLRFGSESILTPEEQFNQLLGRFRELSSDAIAGDPEAIDELLQVNDALSRVRVDFLASSQDAIDVYREQESVLNEIDDSIVDEIGLQRNQLIELQDQTTILDQGFTSIEQAQAELIQAINNINLVVPNVPGVSGGGGSSGGGSSGSGGGSTSSGGGSSLEQRTSAYLEANQDVLSAYLFAGAQAGTGETPQEFAQRHYEEFGRFEGRAAFASGGFVTGPGTSTSDSIPARLSNGEFVIQASAVQNVGVDFLRSINNNSVSFGRSSFNQSQELADINRQQIGVMMGIQSGINDMVNLMREFVESNRGIRTDMRRSQSNNARGVAV